MCSSLSTRARSSVDTPNLMFGLGIMVTGIVLTLDTAGVLDAARTVRFWPAILIAGGAIALTRSFSSPDRRAMWWGWAWIGLGTWLLLRTLGLVQVSLWSLLWPLLLVVFGLRLGLHALRPSRAPRAAGAPRLYALLSESKGTIQHRPFPGGSISAVLGACNLNLRDATMPPSEEGTVLDVFGVFAGHELRVPEDWIVDSEIVPIASTIEDKRWPDRRPAPADAPRLRLRGLLLFSALTIRN
jgi:hypothetical protein